MKFKRTIRNLFFITFFISLTIPKAGTYLYLPRYLQHITLDFSGRVGLTWLPVTLGHIIFSLLFLIWIISNRKKMRDIFLGSFIKKAGIFYLIYTFLRYLFIGFNNKYIGLTTVNYIVYGGHLLIFYLALDMARYGKKIVPILVKIIVISMTIVSLYGLMQVFFDSEEIALVGITETYGSPEDPVVSYSYGGGHILGGSASMKNSIAIKDDLGRTVFVGRKVFSTFHHGNLFGGHLVLFAPIIFSLLCMSVQRRQKIVYFCLAVIISLSLLFANSRGALIGFFISCLTLFLISAKKKKAFLLLTLILLSSVVLFNLILGIAQRYNFKITSADALLYQKVFVQDRYGTYLEIPQLIQKKLSPQETPVDDVELNRITNYRYREFKKICSEFFAKKNIKYLIFGRTDNSMEVSHNLYIDLLRNLGIVGLSLFLYIIIYILWTGIKSEMISDPVNSTETRVLVMGGISGVIGFLTQNFFNNLFYFPPFGLNFWILGGIVLAAASNIPKKILSCE